MMATRDPFVSQRMQDAAVAAAALSSSNAHSIIRQTRLYFQCRS